MDQAQKEALLPLSTSGETTLDAAAAIAGIAPWLGAPLAAVLSGMSSTRKIRRIRDVLARVSESVTELRTDVQRVYVKSEDFEDLLEHTLRSAADERNEEKRRMYGAFLAGAIESPGEPPYDEQIRILRVLEQLQPDHVRVLRAVKQAPDPNGSGFMGSPMQTLNERLPDLTEDRIDDLVHQLDDLRLTGAGQSLRTMMTFAGAQDLRSRVLPFGERFVAFLSRS